MTWKDISILQFQQLKGLRDNLTEEQLEKEMVSIISDITVFELNEMLAGEYEELRERAASVLSSKMGEKFRPVIEINGVKYAFEPRLSAIRMGQWIDIEALGIADGLNDLHTLMAILYRPAKETPEGLEVEPYSSHTMRERAENFLYSMSIEDANSAAVFFSLIASACIGAPQTSPQEKTRMTLSMTRV